MKKIFIVLLIAILAATPVVFAACSRVSQTDMLTDPFVAENAEIFTYDVFTQGNVIGTMTMTFTKLKNADVVLPDPTAENQERTISSFTGTRITMHLKMDETTYNDDEETSEVLYENSYAPVYSYKHTSIGGTVKDMCVVYEDGYAYTYLYENGEKKDEAELSDKNPTFDNEMIYAVARSSDIIHASSGSSLSFYSPNALIADRESITISKVQDINENGLEWVPKDDEGKSLLECSLLRVAVANEYASAKAYALYIANKKISATFHKTNENSEDIAYQVEGVTKAIVKIEEGSFSYILKSIELV